MISCCEGLLGRVVPIANEDDGVVTMSMFSDNDRLASLLAV
jgi:glutamate 5-kinase